MLGDFTPHAANRYNNKPTFDWIRGWKTYRKESGKRSIPLQNDSENWCRAQSHSIELSEIEGKRTLSGAGKWNNNDGKENWEVIWPRVMTHFPRAGREEKVKEKSGCRRHDERVGVVGLLRGRSEMTQSTFSSADGSEVSLECQRGWKQLQPSEWKDFWRKKVQREKSWFHYPPKKGEQYELRYLRGSNFLANCQPPRS